MTNKQTSSIKKPSSIRSFDEKKFLKLADKVKEILDEEKKLLLENEQKTQERNNFRSKLLYFS